MTVIRYFDISWVSKVDGPGKRVVVFLQGCPLRCPWCHSPHSWKSISPILLNKNMCTLCGACVQVCGSQVHQISQEGHSLCTENCQSCGLCINTCPMSARDSLKSALVLPTKESDAATFYKDLRPQLMFLKKIGGITLSGGEAMLQSEAVVTLLKLCKEDGIHTAVETVGLLPTSCYEAVSGLVDCWLVGLRGLLEGSAEFEQASLNMSFLKTLQGEIILRMPIVCGFTDAPEQIEGAVRFMQKHTLNTIELLPYHANTPHYYEALGMIFKIGSHGQPSQTCLQQIQTQFERANIHARISSPGV